MINDLRGIGTECWQKINMKIKKKLNVVAHICHVCKPSTWQVKAAPGEGVGLLGGLPDSDVVTWGTEILMRRDRYIGHVPL